MNEIEKLDLRLRRLTSLLGETEGSQDLVLQTKQLTEQLNSISEPNYMFSNLLAKYLQVEDILNDAPQRVNIVQKEQDILCFEPDLTNAIKLADTSKLQELAQTLDSSYFHRAAELNSKLPEMLTESAELDSKLRQTEAETFNLVSKYHNEISALNEILITLDTHLNKLQQKLLQPE